MRKKKTVRRLSNKPRTPSAGGSADFNIFICWSGGRSREVALALHDWLPRVNQFSRPWMSDVDIDKGAKWEEQLGNQLNEKRFGVICLTPGNLDSRWVLFEAGAMSRDFDAPGDSRVSPYLFDLSYADVLPPLTQFQSTIADEKDTRKLVFSINRALGTPLDNGMLGESFDLRWPMLADKLKKIPPPPQPAPKRADSEILGEILEHVREIKRNSTNPYNAPLGPNTRLQDVYKLYSTEQFEPGQKVTFIDFKAKPQAPFNWGPAILNVVSEPRSDDPHAPPKNPAKKK